VLSKRVAVRGIGPETDPQGSLGQCRVVGGRMAWRGIDRRRGGLRRKGMPSCKCTAMLTQEREAGPQRAGLANSLQQAMCFF
jgi:hypothetical protein